MRKIALLVLSLFLAAPVYADIIYYGDGSKSEGKIIKENDKIVVIREVDAGGVVCETEAQKSTILKIIRESGEKQKERVVKIKESRKIKIEKPPKPLPPPKPVKVKPLVVKPVLEPVTVVAKEKPKPAAKVVRNCSYTFSRRENKDITIGDVKMKRREVTIIVSKKIPYEQLKDIFECVAYRELRKARNNLDALWIIVMRKNVDTDGVPSAYGIWAPPGGWDDFLHTRDKTTYRWEYRKIKKWI